MKVDYSILYEEKLVKILARHSRILATYYGEFLQKVSPHIAMMNPGTVGANIWVSNPTVKRIIDQELKVLHGKIKNLVISQSAEVWELSNKKTDDLINSMIEGLPLSNLKKEKWFARNVEALQQFQKRKIAGKGLSARVWKPCAELRNQLKLYVESGLSEGISAGQLSRDVRQFLNEPDKRFRRVRDPETGKLKLSKPMQDYHPGRGVYRSSYKNALRMTRTEVNMAYRLADMERYRKLDFITGYEVKLSASHPEYDICDSMQGKYPKTFTFLGWHPNCFCYVVPIMWSDNQFKENIINDTIPTGGKIKGIPPEARRYIKEKSPTLKKAKNKPYWLRDFKYKNGAYVPKDYV